FRPTEPNGGQHVIRFVPLDRGQTEEVRKKPLIYQRADVSHRAGSRISICLSIGPGRDAEFEVSQIQHGGKIVIAQWLQPVGNGLLQTGVPTQSKAPNESPRRYTQASIVSGSPKESAPDFSANAAYKVLVPITQLITVAPIRPAHAMRATLRPTRQLLATDQYGGNHSLQKMTLHLYVPLSQ